MKSKTVLFFIGRSGSGKSTTEEVFVRAKPAKFKKVVSLTTRPPRDGEVNGKDYYFITDREFDLLDSKGEIIQYTEFAGYRYGSTRSEYTTHHSYAILCVVPKSAAEFIPILKHHFPEIKVKIVYFNISEVRLRQNMKKRGDSDEMIDARLAKDTLDKDFEESGLTADYTVTDVTLDCDTPYRIETWLYKSKE